ncbi:hypothetical protein GGR52DRAFT_81256 [Hypoxylon sp. FL1284]|nr:hypothetical protein GGR52DRAFT_81256 [Hypoxylon sp. FL1284]
MSIWLWWSNFIPVTLCACGGMARAGGSESSSPIRRQEKGRKDKIFVRCGVDQRHEEDSTDRKETRAWIRGSIYGRGTYVRTYNSRTYIYVPYLSYGTGVSCTYSGRNRKLVILYSLLRSD